MWLPERPSWRRGFSWGYTPVFLRLLLVDKLSTPTRLAESPAAKSLKLAKTHYCLVIATPEQCGPSKHIRTLPVCIWLAYKPRTTSAYDTYCAEEADARQNSTGATNPTSQKVPLTLSIQRGARNEGKRAANLPATICQKCSTFECTQLQQYAPAISPENRDCFRQRKAVSLFATPLFAALTTRTTIPQNAGLGTPASVDTLPERET